MSQLLTLKIQQFPNKANDDPVPKSVDPAPKSVISKANLAPKPMVSSSMTGLDDMTPLAEIKSILFGNTRDETSDDDDDLELF